MPSLANYCHHYGQHHHCSSRAVVVINTICCVIKLFLGKCDTYVYLPHSWRPQQTKVRILPKSNLVNYEFLEELLIGVWVRDYLQVQKQFKTAAPPRTMHKHYEIWSTLHSLNTPQQVGECLFFFFF